MGRSLPLAIQENQEDSSSEENGSPHGSVEEEPEEEIVFENQETSSSEGSGSPHKPDASDHGQLIPPLTVLCL
jgi:hypothetical protein